MSLHKDLFTEDYQKTVGMSAPGFLHEASKELLGELIAQNVLFDGMNIFEMGAGPCRNLKYINDHNPTVNLYASDLHRDASFANMDETIRNKVTFYERDSLALVREFTPDYHIDLFMAIDHWMHIDPASVKEIVGRVVNVWRPTYILIREVHEDGHAPKRKLPRYHHNYDFGDYHQIRYLNSRVKPKQHTFYIKLLRKLD